MEETRDERTRRLAREYAARRRAADGGAANREAARKRREADGGAANRTSVKAWREANPERFREQTEAWRKANPERIREIQRGASTRYRATLRAEGIAAYGPDCRCCGTTDNLTFDHVNGDGSADRIAHGAKTNAGQTYVILARLRKQGWPTGRLQVLCAPCNNSKGRSESCRINHEE